MLIQEALKHSSSVGQIAGVRLCVGSEYARELSSWTVRGRVRT
jgi:hypothetical protein